MFELRRALFADQILAIVSINEHAARKAVMSSCWGVDESTTGFGRFFNVYS